MFCTGPNIPSHLAPTLAVWPTCCSLRWACSSQADSKLNALLKLAPLADWVCLSLPTEGLACACGETPCLPTWFPALQRTLPCGSASHPTPLNLKPAVACLQSPAFVGFSYSNTSRDARVGEWAGRDIACCIALHLVIPVGWARPLSSVKAGSPGSQSTCHRRLQVTPARPATLGNSCSAGWTASRRCGGSL